MSMTAPSSDSSCTGGAEAERQGHAKTVYVDLETGLFHTIERHAGDEPMAFTRTQAERFGYDACPDCYRVTDLGGADR